jgi:glucose-1-phosphate cytidylyltransferase
MMTYGDSVANVNLRNLRKFHEKNKALVTLTAVKPTARFGAVKIRGSKVTYFKEKSSVDVGWINGGFMVINSKFFNFIRGDKTFLEREPLEKLVKTKKLSAFKFNGFWQCMDTKRDKDRLEKLLKSKKF